MSSKDTYKNSGLDRAKPKKHGFHAFINKTFKRHRADTTGLVEDSASSTTVVRIIIGLILVHLIVIGGVLLRSHIVKNDGGVAVAAGTAITPPPVQQAALPQATPAATQTAAATGNHITQPVDELVAEEDPTPVTATPAAPATQPTVTVPHRIATGDTLTKISGQYGVTIAAIKKANPGLTDRLQAGAYLNIPVAADSEAARKAAATVVIPTAPAAKTYVVKKGETLSSIAKKHKMSTAKLMKINDMTDKDARRLKPGTELKVSE